MTDRDNFIDESVRRFLALVAAEAHGGLPAARRHEAEAIMADLAGHQFDLMAALERGEIGPEAWLPRFTELLRARYGELGRVLGRDRFERVFGAAPEDAPAVIDPQAFAMTHELSATGRARS